MIATIIMIPKHTLQAGIPPRGIETNNITTGRNSLPDYSYRQVFPRGGLRLENMPLADNLLFVTGRYSPEGD